MQDFEKLGVFYLGKEVDPQTKKVADTPLLYQSKDLLTHAVCVGMTGSGKTGLCIGLLEEAAIDGIPAIAIDPKGDIANLMLTFPELRAEDFRPWIQEDEARAKGVSPEAFAAQQAESWEKGLASFGQDGARIARLKSAAPVVIYTPGSEAGLPVSILKSFAAPDPKIVADEEMMRDRVSGTATSLLSLIGVDADPVQSRDHVLLSNIFYASWKAGTDLDLAGIIVQIQKPPFQKAGVLDLETFYPAKERFVLAMSFNNVMASPGFGAWLNGEPLDVNALLYTPEGKPRITILSIAHLSDQERMFFVSLFLNQVLSWVRTQAGTTSLRALLYMDEIFGYFPPVANPPSKKPLLTLLKQARAYGLGLVLATQNPVDLDYKGLSNTGTWFIGRLQTERDKMRIMGGLEGAAGEAHATFGKEAIGQLISGLGSRVFLLNNVHEDRPQLFQTRWTLSYLRGPLTREQIQKLMTPLKHADSLAANSAVVGGRTIETGKTTVTPPVLPPDVACYFLPVESPSATSYQPVLLGVAKLHYLDEKRSIDQSREIVFITDFNGDAGVVDWDKAVEASLSSDEFEKEPEPGIPFADVPSAAVKVRNYAAWNRSFANWLFQTQQLKLLRSDTLDERSKPGESERDFRIRLQQVAREERDRVAEALKQKFAPKLGALAERKRRAEAAVMQQKAQQSQAVLQTALTVGSGLLSAFLGRKALSATTVSKAASAARQAGRSWKESQDVTQANETVEQLENLAKDLQAEFETELSEQQSKINPNLEEFQTECVRLKKANVEVRLLALGWQAGVPKGENAVH